MKDNVNLKMFFILGFLLGPLLGLGQKAAAEESSQNIAAFDKLKSLVGNWTAETSAGKFVTVELELISNDTVLVENWIYKKGVVHSTTIYHIGDSELIATHYCPQGNQPRLKMSSIAKDQSKLIFEFKDITHTGNKNRAHLKSMVFSFSGKDSFHKIETYTADGKDYPTTLSFKKVDQNRM